MLDWTKKLAICFFASLTKLIYKYEQPMYCIKFFQQILCFIEKYRVNISAIQYLSRRLVTLNTITGKHNIRFWLVDEKSTDFSSLYRKLEEILIFERCICRNWKPELGTGRNFGTEPVFLGLRSGTEKNLVPLFWAILGTERILYFAFLWKPERFGNVKIGTENLEKKKKKNASLSFVYMRDREFAWRKFARYENSPGSKVCLKGKFEDERSVTLTYSTNKKIVFHLFT